MLNQIITIDNAATSGGATLAAAVAAATAGETFSVTIGGSSGTGALYSATVGSAYSTAGDYSLEALASDLTSTTRTATARAARFDMDDTDAASMLTKLGSRGSGDTIVVTVNDGTSATTYTLALTAGSATLSDMTAVAAEMEARAVGTNTGGTRDVTFNNDKLQATFDTAGVSQNSYTVTFAFTDADANIAANNGDSLMEGQSTGAEWFNDATFSVVDGDIVATLV